MDSQSASLPKVQLNRWQTVRLTVVGIVVAFMLLRVVPDVYRFMVPLGTFDYATNDNGVVIKAPADRPKGTDALLAGDKVRVDRIRPFDRKPGLVRIGFTQYNFDRWLPIERDGIERVVHLKATAEPMASRAVVGLRILLYVAAVCFGAMLLIVNPRLATFAFFVFCLGGAEPTSFTDTLFDPPWREIPAWIGDTISGQAPFALLLFALCLFVNSHRTRVVIAAVLASSRSHSARCMPTIRGARSTAHCPPRRTGSFTREPRRSRTSSQRSHLLPPSSARAARIGSELPGSSPRLPWPAAGRILSERFFPAYLNFWENGTLLSLSIIPVVVVWIAVVKHHFFDVRFHGQPRPSFTPRSRPPCCSSSAARKNC